MVLDVYPVDYSTNVGRVRKYVPDVEQLSDPLNPTVTPSFIFSDAEIQAFLDDETADGTLPVRGYHVKRAAAWAMIALANNENLILKKIVTQDQQTDGPSVAKALIASAATLLARADAEEATAVEAIAPETFYAVFPEQTHQRPYTIRGLR